MNDLKVIKVNGRSHVVRPVMTRPANIGNANYKNTGLALTGILRIDGIYEETLTAFLKRTKAHIRFVDVRYHQ